MEKTLNNFWGNVEKFKAIYRRLKFAHKEDLSSIADEFDKWFLNDFKEMILQQSNWEGKKFALPDDETVVDNLVQESVNAAYRIIYPRIIKYMSDYFAEFFREGLKLADFNARMENDTVENELTEEDKKAVRMLYNTESKVWRSHIEKHRRQLDRELTGAMLAGSTIDEFIMRFIAPDTHVVAYPYGNARISWSEHIRRFLAGRPRMIATTAHMRRRGI
ncbi:MAG: hypothetical protein KAU20_03535 [Nanoarchaeota archaeon]|nr:hypothetical protein [Nanoarchaeota archaeon]